MLVGDQLGLYRALAKRPLTPAELAARTGTHERYIREWLGNQAAGGYVSTTPAASRYSLSEEQALCLADPDGPVDLPGAYSIVEATFHTLDRTMENFRTRQGHGMGRAPPVPVPRHRALLPRRLPRPPARRMAAGAGWRGGEARAPAARSPTSAAATAPAPR